MYYNHVSLLCTRDLEDVRQAMTALADIREHQIHLDMSLGPIEVRMHNVLHFNIVLYSSQSLNLHVID